MSRFELNRRQVLQGSAALAAGTFVHLPLARQARAQASKTLRVRQPLDISGIDPAFYNNRADINVTLATQTKLIEYLPKESWEWGLEAAESMTQLDDTHIEFKLREGIMWSPKELGELTADDVKFSFERVRDEKMASPFKEELNPIQKVEVSDKYKGVIVLSEPSAAIWSYLPWVTASIVSRKAVEALADKKFTVEPPCYGGAYKVAKWTPKQELVLTANESWFGPKPEFEEVKITPIDDDKTAELAFEAGEFDFLEIAISSIKTYKDNPPKDAKLIVRPNLGVRWLGMNTEAKPLDDQRVRRAVQLAVNVDEMIDAAYYGIAPRATGVIPPGMVGYREKNKYGRDIAEAKKLLAEAGHPDGIDVHIAVENNADMVTLAQLVQAQAAEAGIKVSIDAMESGTFWVQGSEKDGDYWKKLQLFIHNWGWAPDPSSATMWYTPDQIGVWNWERWNSPEYAELNKAALKELDAKKRGDIYVKMMDMMEESGAYLFLTPGINPLLVRDGIEAAISPDGRRHFFKMFKHAA